MQGMIPPNKHQMSGGSFLCGNLCSFYSTLFSLRLGINYTPVYFLVFSFLF